MSKDSRADTQSILSLNPGLSMGQQYWISSAGASKWKVYTLKTIPSPITTSDIIIDLKKSLHMLIWRNYLLCNTKSVKASVKNFSPPYIRGSFMLLLQINTIMYLYVNIHRFFIHPSVNSVINIRWSNN